MIEPTHSIGMQDALSFPQLTKILWQSSGDDGLIESHRATIRVVILLEDQRPTRRLIFAQFQVPCIVFGGEFRFKPCEKSKT
jgi:hypothetical protein